MLLLVMRSSRRAIVLGPQLLMIEDSPQSNSIDDKDVQHAPDNYEVIVEVSFHAILHTCYFHQGILNLKLY